MALPASAKRDATFEDLHDVPEHHVAEIIDGDLYAGPRPATLAAQEPRALKARNAPMAMRAYSFQNAAICAPPVLVK